MGAFVAGAVAGPLDKAKVGAGAKWVVHVDVEAAMKSTTGKFVAEHRAALDLEPIEEFKKKSGLDAFKDIKDVTVYGTTDVMDQAVALVRGTKAVEAAVEKLMAEDKTVERTESDGKTVYSWTEDGSKRFGQLRKQGEDRVFVVSQGREVLVGALSVLDGGSPSVAGQKEGVMSHAPREGAIVYIAARGFDGVAPKSMPKVLRSAREATGEFGEDAAGMYGDLWIKADAADDVKDIAEFARGMLATGRMATKGDDELKEIHEVLKGIAIEAKGDVLTASIRISKELLTSALDDLKTELEQEKPKPAIEKTSKEEKPEPKKTTKKAKDAEKK